MKITNLDHEAKFTQMLTSLLDEHKDVVSMLADGFYQSRDYIKVSVNCLLALLGLVTSRQYLQSLDLVLNCKIMRKIDIGIPVLF